MDWHFQSIMTTTIFDVAKETKLIRVKRIRKPFTYGTPETIIKNIPGGGHYTRTIKI